MTDPYRILGVSRAASEDEIKKAYRALSRKYHPDTNSNNPDRDGTEEQFKELQLAYRQIIEEKERGYAEETFDNFQIFGDYRQSGQGAPYQSDASDMHLTAAANYIQNHYFQEALHLLGQMSERTALWYYYSAVANAGIGNHILALEHARQASMMEPDNHIFIRFERELEAGGNWYQSMQASYDSPLYSRYSYCTSTSMACVLCEVCCSEFGNGRGFFERLFLWCDR